MEHSTICLIIMAITLLLYAVEKVPLAVTALLSMLAMAFTGCLSYSEAFSGFSNTATLMIIGTGIIGEAVFTTGLADTIGRRLLSMRGLSEKRMVIVMVIAGAVLSALLNALIVMAIFIPIIDIISVKSEGKVTRKNLYLPVGIAAVFGGNLTSIGSTSMINASGMLGESYLGRPMMFFEPLILALPGVAICVIVFLVSGCRLQNRTFDFPDIHPETVSYGPMGSGPVWKQWFIVADLFGCVVAFIMGCNYGAIALLGGCLAILTGCIDAKRAIRGVNWSTVLIVAGTLGFARGVDASGAGKIIADRLLSWCGPLSASPYAMSTVMLFLGTLLSNFMSNNATVGILVPISLSMCKELGGDPVVFTLACAIGANLSVMTPICTATITMTSSAGYRFKDYVRFGGVFNVLTFLATALVMRIYF